MLTSPPRQRQSRQHRHLVKSPRADEVATVEHRKACVLSTEEAADPSARPTLDDFGGRSDALGG